MFTAPLVSSLTELVGRLRRKGLPYWARLLLTVILVKSLVGWMDRQGILEGYRTSFYQLLQRTSPFKLADKNTVVVFIDDEDYWKGELDRRVPIKRDYLAKLLDKLDVADARVIALDFDLRSPDPDGMPREAPDYVAETTMLLNSVKAIAVNRSIVLPKTVSQKNGDPIADSDIWNGFDFGNGNENVSSGFILPPNDRLRVPLTLQVQGAPLFSFSMAIARAFRPNGVASLPDSEEFPYGSFMPVDQIWHISSHDVLNGNSQQLRKLFSGRIAIIGSAWNRLAYGRPPLNDLHRTPIGPMPGVYVHANFVEDILNDKTYPALGEHAIEVIEWLLVIVMAIAFAVGSGRASKLKFVGGSWLLLAAMSYFSFINLGIVFDMFVPALSVTVHWLFERAWEALQKERESEQEATS